MIDLISYRDLQTVAGGEISLECKEAICSGFVAHVASFHANKEDYSIGQSLYSLKPLVDSFFKAKALCSDNEYVSSVKPYVIFFPGRTDLISPDHTVENLASAHCSEIALA